MSREVHVRFCESAGVKFPRATHLVILCRQEAQEARGRMEAIMARLKLRVNPQKTRVCRAPEQSFDFLGYTFGHCHSARTGRAYIGTIPSKKRVQRLCGQISQLTCRATTRGRVEEIVRTLNAKTRGWAAYFSLGPVSKAYRAVDAHACHRLRQWLCAKHQVQGQGKRLYGDRYLHEELGLLRLGSLTVNLPWAKT